MNERTDERILRYFPESTPKRLIEGVLPQILEQVSWQLCGPRREEATVALQAVAHISYRHHDKAVRAFCLVERASLGTRVIAPSVGVKLFRCNRFLLCFGCLDRDTSDLVFLSILAFFPCHLKEQKKGKIVDIEFSVGGKGA